MDNSTTTSDLLRLIGVMAVGVGLAWAFQVLGFGGSTALGRMMWIVSAAATAGAGSGLIVASSRFIVAAGRNAR